MMISLIGESGSANASSIDAAELEPKNHGEPHGATGIGETNGEPNGEPNGNGVAPIPKGGVEYAELVIKPVSPAIPTMACQLTAALGSAEPLSEFA